ncbi:unnamed protein product [Phytophthora fragariaefolia]|uniref:Unnamed protein product n=1 Tax=Phytophthora fragariaefolia TaxID=1490495 RepID=A0A9W6UDK0_9STRA|nr:unnamed protein product [Phytophthora fragariaefolia]
MSRWLQDRERSFDDEAFHPSTPPGSRSSQLPAAFQQSSREGPSSTSLPASASANGIPVMATNPVRPQLYEQPGPVGTNRSTQHEDTRPQYTQPGFLGIPAEVQHAVSNYQPKVGFELVVPGSCIYKWGVRVRHVSDLTVCGWICLASEHCRSNKSVHLLYGGKTSRATKHLKEVHQVSSLKSSLEDTRKRTRDDIVGRIRAAAQTQESCERISLLLQTLLVVHNNLPFIMGEWEESWILRAVVTKDNFQAVVNRRTITHSVIELYVPAKRELTRFITDNRLPGVKSLVMVADFWTAKNPGTKFLGLRVYLITAEWELVSVLLGTRHFQPMYGERDGGIRGPFKRWILQILSDFGLTVADFFGSTTDGGPDVQHMMKSNLMLSWEWCMPHLTNAATKAAFGMTSNVARSKNPEMLQLLKKVTMTVYQVRSVEVMGDLYEQLVRHLGVGKEKKLMDYKQHRFMSLTRVFQRIIKHWNVLCLWYEECANNAIRDRSPTPSPFPLSDSHLLMEQLFSLMLPILALNVKSQAEKANQVDVLFSAYKMMVTTLGPEASLRKHDATRENPTSYHHSTLLLDFAE